MKKVLFFVVVAMVSFSSCENEEFILEGDLPGASRTFLNVHFSGVGIDRIKRENDANFNRTYTVYLDNGFEVDFTKSGDWDEIDGTERRPALPVPQSILELLPAGIMQYVGQRFPERYIVKVNRERFGFEIELNGDIELKFNLNGTFRKIDD